MLTRAVTGGIYVTVVILSTYFGGLFLQLVFGIITALLLYEFTAMFAKTDSSPNVILTIVYGLAIYIFGIVFLENFNISRLKLFTLLGLLLFGSSFLWFGTAELLRRTLKPIYNIALSIAAIAYIVPAMVLISFMSLLGPNPSANMFPLLGVFIMIWSYDTFAYLIGRKFGKSKMAEHLSPNKSWEGFIGGVVFAVIAGLIIAYFQEEQPFIAYFILGLVCSGFGMLGDLFESMIKRNVGVKDSSNLLPGHGGFLDRFDSVLFVMPVAVVVTLVFMFYL